MTATRPSDPGPPRRARCRRSAGAPRPTRTIDACSSNCSRLPAARAPGEHQRPSEMTAAPASTARLLPARRVALPAPSRLPFVGDHRVRIQRLHLDRMPRRGRERRVHREDRGGRRGPRGRTHPVPAPRRGLHQPPPPVLPRRHPRSARPRSPPSPPPASTACHVAARRACRRSGLRGRRGARPHRRLEPPRRHAPPTHRSGMAAGTSSARRRRVSAAIPPWSSAVPEQGGASPRTVAAPKASTAQHRVKLDQARSTAALGDGRVASPNVSGQAAGSAAGRPAAASIRLVVIWARPHDGAVRGVHRARAFVRRFHPARGKSPSPPPRLPWVAIRTRRGGRGAESERTVTRLSSAAPPTP